MCKTNTLKYHDYLLQQFTTSPKINAQKILSKHMTTGTTYYLSIEDGKKHQTVDNELARIEKNIQNTHSISQGIFVPLGTGTPGIVKSFAQGTSSGDEDWQYIFKKSNQPQDNVEIYSANSNQPSSATPTPTYVPETTPSSDTTMSPEPEAATTMQAQDTSMSPEPEDPGTPQGQDPTLLPEPYPAYDELPPLPARYAHLFPDEMALQVQDQPSPTETALCTTMESLSTSQVSQQKIKLLEAENAHQKERCTNLETDFKDLKIQYTSLEKARATMQLVLKNDLPGPRSSSRFNSVPRSSSLNSTIFSILQTIPSSTQRFQKRFRPRHSDSRGDTVASLCLSSEFSTRECCCCLNNVASWFLMIVCFKLIVALAGRPLAGLLLFRPITRPCNPETALLENDEIFKKRIEEYGSLN